MCKGIRLIESLILMIIFIFIIIVPICCENASPESDTSNFNQQDKYAKYFDDYVNNLRKGRLIYNPSDEMIINNSEQINATITQNKDNSSSLGEEIKVAPIMEVHLKGSAFDISPITESRQFTTLSGPTTWKWDVVPNRIGNQTLDLLAYAIAEMPDGHEERRALVKNKTILVKINPIELPYPVRVISNPSGAEVIVDEIFMGTAPINISGLALGFHKLKLKHPGYLDYETVIQVKPFAYNQTYNLESEPNLLFNPTVFAAIIAGIAAIIIGAMCQWQSKNPQLWQ